MKRSRRLDSVLRLAKSREREAAAKLAQARHQLSQRQELQQQLLRHQSEYREQAKSQATIPASAIKVRRAFVGQLQRAFEQQAGAIEAARRQVEQARRDWLAQRVRFQSIEKARNQMRDDEALVETRAEQRRLDELSSSRR